MTEFNNELEPEVQNESDNTKEVPCGECGRRLTVSKFYAPESKARCTECKGEAKEEAAAGRRRFQAMASADKSQYADLKDALLNRAFSRAVCPVHPDDPEHEMELKSVSHSAYHGPTEFMGYQGGRPLFRQLAEGETVMHQCSKCLATVSYSTTAQVQFCRQNEPGLVHGRGVNAMSEFLGFRQLEETS